MSERSEPSSAKKAQFGPLSLRPKQCQICRKTANDLPDRTKLLCCGACRREYYCSKKCQRAAWNQHKTICASNQRVLSALRAHEDPSLASCESMLTKWTKLFRPVLRHALARALELDKTPRRILDAVLIVALSRTSEKAVEKAFIVEAAHVASMDFIRATWNLSEAALANTLEDSRNSLNSGGGGCGLVMVRVTDNGICHVMPFPFSRPVPPPEVGSEESQWEEQLMDAIRMGRISQASTSLLCYCLGLFLVGCIILLFIVGST
ncbi:hypothetical protein EXIGLDRAFT_736354 [Exidia glandulosa HHB12029]|uniref:MYND-type domain-containing protein n=1 Tax=Exidia glandulosa HHB12029 TaxID=1314781 RepID=A0A166N7X8_EXIGL|nr:hypothetical protein EXIGLDRAFT_736354 [Exidia glandulosa HHB12029]